MFDFERVPTLFGVPVQDDNVRLARMEVKLNSILKRVRNRHIVNYQTGRETFYENDQQTVLQSNILKDINGDTITKPDEIAEATPEIINDAT
ncbi:MAG: hypothetical protein OXC46_04295 [Thaumarchaeota archaeon]|nr:hypothetical protein [Nitrososphaerota archaeon]